MGISKIVMGAAGTVFMASAATAAPVSPPFDSRGRALILIPLSLTKVQDIDFGTVVPSASPGTVTIAAADGARSFTGGVTLVASGAGDRAVFAGAGTPNQQVLLTIAPPASLDDTNGNSIPVSLELEFTDVNIDPASRAFSVGVGGTIDIDADQAEGLYSGDFSVTANYQ